MANAAADKKLKAALESYRWARRIEEGRLPSLFDHDERAADRMLKAALDSYRWDDALAALKKGGAAVVIVRPRRTHGGQES